MDETDRELIDLIKDDCLNRFHEILEIERAAELILKYMEAGLLDPNMPLISALEIISQVIDKLITPDANTESQDS